MEDISLVNKKIKLMELFSGIGGFSKGFVDAGYEIETHWFSEIDRHAIANYKYNFPNAEYIGSVTDVRGGAYSADVITFGSPCQDFSLAGKRLGMGGERSSLVSEAIRIISECRPGVFIWENVKGAFSSNSGADFWGIISAFADIGGYRLEWQLLNTSWFLPQNRERIYLVGHLAGRSGVGVFPIGDGNKLYSDKSDEQGLQQNAQSLTATSYEKWRGNFVNETTIVGELNSSQDGKVFSVEGDSQTLSAGHGNVPKILNKGRGFNKGSEKEIVGSITKNSFEQNNFVKQVNASLESGDQQPYQQNRIYDESGIAPALMKDKSDLLILGNLKGEDGHNVNNVYGIDGIAPTVRENHGKVTPICVAQRGRNPENPSDRTVGAHTEQRLEANSQGTTNTLTGVQKDNLIVTHYGHKNKDAKVSKISPTLKAQSQSHGHEPMVTNTNMAGVSYEHDYAGTIRSNASANYQTVNNIRRLTEIECERLQGFPDDEKTCIFTVWKDCYIENQNKTASAETQNHRSQKSVGRVEKKDSKGNVSSASLNLNIKNQQIKKLVLVSVLLHCEARTVEIHSQGKLLLSASNVGAKNSSVPQIQIENFAQLLVDINLIVAKITTCGKEDCQQNDKSPIQVLNGNLHVNLFGKEMTQLVNSVKSDTLTTKKPTKSITSVHSEINCFEQKLPTSFYCVMDAIRSFIPEKTLNENSFQIEIKINHGWTKFGNYDGVVKQIPKTQRYKLCGNAVTVAVVEAIAKRLKLQTKTKKQLR